jgi:hypothetical protein
MKIESIGFLCKLGSLALKVEPAGLGLARSPWPGLGMGDIPARVTALGQDAIERELFHHGPPFRGGSA